MEMIKEELKLFLLHHKKAHICLSQSLQRSLQSFALNEANIETSWMFEVDLVESFPNECF